MRQREIGLRFNAAVVRPMGTDLLTVRVDIAPTSAEPTDDASRTAVAKITVQPGARFPWHTHSGPVVVNIDQGTLTYVEGDDCHERTYSEGQAFVDSGHGHVHTAYNPGTTPTVIYATLFEAPETGPLNIPAPTPDCAR